MTLFDLAIVVAVLAVGCLGAYDGLVRAFWALLGILAGTALGMVLVPLLFGSVDPSLWVGLVSLVVLVGLGAGGREVAVRLEKRTLMRLGWTPVPWLDRAGGAVLGIAAGLGFSWMVGLALAGSTLPNLAPAANGSMLLRTLDRTLPLSHFIAQRFEELGDSTDFPRYVDVFTTEEIVPVPPPPRDIVDEPGVVRAAGVRPAHPHPRRRPHRLRGLRLPDRPRPADDRRARDLPLADHRRRHRRRRAAGDDRRVRPGARRGRARRARPERRRAHLHLGGGWRSGGRRRVPAQDVSAITPARVRERLEWQSADIYGEGRYDHDAYSVRAEVHMGNSGGPMVAPTAASSASSWPSPGPTPTRRTRSPATRSPLPSTRDGVQQTGATVSCR